MPPKPAEVPRGLMAVVSAMPEFLANERYSDLTLRLGERQWKLHKLVVCPQSGYFTAACDGEWKEAQEGVIEIHDDDELAVDAMVEYLYTGSYTPPQTSYANPNRSMLNLNVFTIADKYDLPLLSQFASSKFETSVCGDYMTPGFGKVIEELYDNGPDNELSRAMRRCTVKQYVYLGEELFSSAGLTEIRDAIRDVTLFGMEMRLLDETNRSHKASLKNAEEAHKEALKRERALQRNEGRITCNNCGGSFVAEVISERPRTVKRYCPYCSHANMRHS